MEAMNSLSLLFTLVFLFTYSNAASQVRFLKGFSMFLNVPYKKMPACQAASTLLFFSQQALREKQKATRNLDSLSQRSFSNGTTTRRHSNHKYSFHQTRLLILWGCAVTGADLSHSRQSLFTPCFAYRSCSD